MTKTLTTEQAAALATVRTAFGDRIAKIEALLSTHLTGFVFCWEKYALGIKLVDGKSRTVSIEDATVVGSRYNATFYNGNHEYAVLMPRRMALEKALISQSETLAHFEAALTKAA